MNAAKPIAVVQGAPTPVIQDLMRRFVASLGAGVRLAGVIEEPEAPTEGPCHAGDLKSLADGRFYRMMQEASPEADGCRLDTDGVAAAGADVRGHIAGGCDLVVLNKFGKVEVEGGGLAPAFAAALEGGRPLLTSVAPRFTDAFDRLAGPRYVLLPAEAAAIEDWWRGVRDGAAAASAAAG
jgi:hypothetical protein